MTCDASFNSDRPATGVPLWLVADTLRLTKRQVYRLEKRGELRSWHVGLARVYKLDDVCRVARERMREADRDSRVRRPSEAAVRFLEHGMSPRLCRALVQSGRIPIERAMWSYLGSAGEAADRGEERSDDEFALMGELITGAIRARAYA